MPTDRFQFSYDAEIMSKMIGATLSSIRRNLPEYSIRVRRSRPYYGKGSHMSMPSRSDFSRSARILDYKTTENAEPETFIRQIGRMSYDLQAEFYVRGGKAVIEREPIFIFLAQEISEPYSCSLVGLANSVAL